jgi:hypothetical protein
MQELIRGLFRSDYVKEEDELKHCRTSVPLDERPPAPTTESPVEQQPPSRVELTPPPVSLPEFPQAAQQPHQQQAVPQAVGPGPSAMRHERPNVPPPEEDTTDQSAKKGGFWSKLFKKK